MKEEYMWEGKVGVWRGVWDIKGRLSTYKRKSGRVYRDILWKRDYDKIKIRVTSLTYLLTYLLTPWRRVLFGKLIVTQLVKQQRAFFVELEGSLPCSQKPATGTYPKPAESSSPHRSLSP